MPYHRLRDVAYPLDPEVAAIGEYDFVMVPWSMGLPYERPVPQPIHVQLDPDRGSQRPDLFLTGLPLASPRLLTVLETLGVANLDLYDTELTDHAGRVHTTYKAFNIVGAVACADLLRSDYAEIRPGAFRFGRLVLDEARALGLPLFRLAEDPIHVLVSDPVRAALEAARLVGVHFEAVES